MSQYILNNIDKIKSEQNEELTLPTIEYQESAALLDVLWNQLDKGIILTGWQKAFQLDTLGGISESCIED